MPFLKRRSDWLVLQEGDTKSSFHVIVMLEE